MIKTESLKFKIKQDKYFSIEQPHLRSTVDNYTLKMANKLSLKAGLTPQDKILEIGCGAGRFTVPLLTLGLNITGIDISNKLINELKKSNYNNLKLILGDVDKVSTLTKTKFDKIVGFFILHHIPDLKKSLEELRKVSTRDTIVVFIEPNPWNLLYYPQPFIYKNMSWNEEKGFIKLTPGFIKKTFSASGYKNVKITNFGFLPPFIVSRGLGVKIDNFLEKIPLKTFLPFQLITAKVK